MRPVVIPYKKLLFYDRMEQVEDYDKAEVYCNLAVYYYAVDRPDLAYWYLHRASLKGSLLEYGVLMNILASKHDSLIVKLSVLLIHQFSQENTLNFIEYYLAFLEVENLRRKISK